MSIVTLLAFLVILSVLVFVHELGHFVVAKWGGITVEEFAIGFPPRMVKLWQDEGSITLEGQAYIIPRDVEVGRAVQPGGLVYTETDTDEKGRAIVSKLEAIEPEKPAEGHDDAEEKPQNASWPQGKTVPADGRPTKFVEGLVRPTEYSINWVPLGGYVRMLGEEDPTDPGSFASKSKRIRFAVLIAGSLMNIVAAVFFFSLTSMAGVPEPTTSPNYLGEEAPIAVTIITEVVPDTPASQAGLSADDVIIGADGLIFDHAGDLVEYVNAHKGEEITLTVERDGKTVDVSLVPRVNPPEGQGSIGIGLTYDSDVNLVYYPPHEALVRGVQDTATYVGLTFYMPYAIMQNIFPAEAARPTGPVGIYQQTGSAVNAAVTLDWWYPVLWFTAVLSAALAVTNLLPLPALDGGRILFIIIEALRGKRVSPEKEGAIHLIGLGMLLMLMVVITFYDVSDPLPAIPWNDILAR
ncbi:M50 family metallopeptidase [Anaerolineales bacterium HSG6]|nr:M50 family metallopeptidase [Anaerolineales bacterium HSG6]MDM8532081.1 M50 family metallopeptidase [Anaerolineales bacterium HSG25]